uniref:RRM domain-containing protein n=1 Tax=Oryza punctata TaxID=4537 RepID=A0A0E0MPE8_ORYPU
MAAGILLLVSLEEREICVMLEGPGRFTEKGRVYVYLRRRLNIILVQTRTASPAASAAAAATATAAEAEEEEHTELTCPYNYLAPAAAASYVPCRARRDVWRGDPGASPSSSEHRCFLCRFVRVTNLPVSCRPADLVGLLAGFGPLRMWHVAMDGPGKCKGFAAVVFERREHADEAIEGLNCFSFGGRSLRVDWAYPSA